MPDIPEPEFFPLTLGGRTWALPHLPFGVVKRLQGRVLAFSSALGKLAVADLDEGRLDQLLDITHDAIKAVEPGVAKEALEALAFTSADLIAAQVPIMKALGLIRDKPDAEGDGAGPKA